MNKLYVKRHWRSVSEEEKEECEDCTWQNKESRTVRLKRNLQITLKG